VSALIPDVRGLAVGVAVDAQRDRILDVTRFVNRHPELAHEEFECSRHIAGALATALDVEATLTMSRALAVAADRLTRFTAA